MKLKEFQKNLDEKNFDLAILLNNDLHLTYFTQVKPTEFAFLAITKDQAKFHRTILDQNLIPNKFNKSISTNQINKNWAEKLKQLKPRSVGINKESLTLAQFQRLKKVFPQAKFNDISKTLTQLRIQKTPAEISLIRKACQITDSIFNETISALQNHKNKFNSELDLSIFIENLAKSHGCNLAFPSIVANANNAALLSHSNPHTSKLKSGFLIFDLGVNYQNYCSDMTRTIFLGKPSKSQKELYGLVLNAQKNTIQQANSAKNYFELDEFARKQLGKYSSYFMHSLGHGIGLEAHEAPSFRTKPFQNIQENHAFTIEPGIYKTDHFGIRIEDTLTFHGKALPLTKSFKDELITIKI